MPKSSSNRNEQVQEQQSENNLQLQGELIAHESAQHDQIKTTLPKNTQTLSQILQQQIKPLLPAQNQLSQIELPQNTELKSLSPNELREQRLQELIDWFTREVQWWSQLYRKDQDEVDRDAEIILDELIKSGYTLRDAEAACVHERLRRHRWELSIALFYADDKLTTSEIQSAISRSYARGKRDAMSAHHEQSLLSHQAITHDQMNEFRTIVQLQSRINDLEKENEKLKQEILKLSS